VDSYWSVKSSVSREATSDDPAKVARCCSIMMSSSTNGDFSATDRTASCEVIVTSLQPDRGRLVVADTVGGGGGGGGTGNGGETAGNFR